MADLGGKWKRPKEIEPQHENVMVEIGLKLEKLRNKKGLSASVLVKELGISRNAYRQMEKGKIYFSMYNFLKILAYHKIDLKTFIATPVDNKIFQPDEKKK